MQQLVRAGTEIWVTNYLYRWCARWVEVCSRHGDQLCCATGTRSAAGRRTYERLGNENNWPPLISTSHQFSGTIGHILLLPDADTSAQARKHKYLCRRCIMCICVCISCTRGRALLNHIRVDRAKIHVPYTYVYT